MLNLIYYEIKVDVVQKQNNHKTKFLVGIQGNPLGVRDNPEM